MARLFERQLDETACALRSVVQQQLAWVGRQAAGAVVQPAPAAVAAAMPAPAVPASAPAATPVHAAALAAACAEIAVPVPAPGAPAPALVEPVPAWRPQGDAGTHQLLLLEARDEAGLRARCAQAAAELEALAPGEWAAYADASRGRAGRAPAAWGAALVAESAQAAAPLLAAAGRGEKARAVLRGPRAAQAPRLSLLFSGLGDQYPGMGAELYRRLPTFGRAFDRAAAAFRQVAGADLREAVFGTGDALASARLAHPAVMALQLALAAQWRAWGVAADDALGYSLGDYAAAGVAGVFGEAALLALVARRAELIEAQAEGAMLAVPLPAQALQARLPAGAWVAAQSTPQTSIVAGTPQAIDQLAAQLATGQVAVRRLRATRAFHTPLLAPVAPRLAELVCEAAPGAPAFPLVSGATGSWIAAQALQDPQYWVQHTTGPVRFDAGLATLLAQPGRYFLEVGPGLALSSFLFQHPDAAALAGRPVAGSLPNGDDPRHEVAFLLETLGRLWLAGFSPDWAAVGQDLAAPATSCTAVPQPGVVAPCTTD